jgi:hypothetical protein
LILLVILPLNELKGTTLYFAFAVAAALASEIGPGFSPDITRPTNSGL